MDWLIHFVGDQMDWSQYGGTRGSSSSHYLIDLITFILYNQDLKEPKAVLAAMIDFEKAFNRQNHHKLVTKLSDMGTPGWLLNVVKGFLENRTLTVTYRGAESERKPMPGGGPQGTILGLFLFLIQINDAGFPEEDREVGKRVTAAINKRKEIKTKHLKYVDDLTLAEALNLNTALVNDNNNYLEKPLTYHNRTEHILPPQESLLYTQVEELLNYTKENEMKINKDKTKIMLFNTKISKDFTPKISIEGKEIEVVEELKLLGVKITNDLKWNNNTEYITGRAYKKLWMIRRLKLNGASNMELRDIYCKHVRSVLEYAAVVWHPGLTLENTTSIERVQKSALAIILGKEYEDYSKALDLLKLEKLSTRREALCKKFALKSLKSVKYSSWFVLDEKVCKTRSKITRLKPTQTRTNCFENQPYHIGPTLLTNCSIMKHPSIHVAGG